MSDHTLAAPQKRRSVNVVKFGYTIVYVRNVQRTLDFFQSAFGLKTRFLHDSGDYGELDTGDTILAFASIELGQANFGPFSALAELDRPVGAEVAFVTDDVSGACKRAIDAGAVVLKQPERKPWGQTVAYVQSPDHLIIELCTPVGS